MERAGPAALRDAAMVVVDGVGESIQRHED